MQKKFFVTTPIYYVNASPHIGTAYSTFVADVVARYKRLKGFDVFFLSGTDEHGQKIQREAAAHGKAPKEFCDEMAGQFKKTWRELGISNDYFVRTTDSQHERAVQHLFQLFYDNGDIYLGKYEGWYCTPCETFYPESKLVSGNCPACGRAVERMSEETYFFRLSKYRDKLLGHFRKNPEFVLPKFRANEMVNILKEGLEDLSVSRTKISWGIPCPFDKRHVVYVWFDALINYLSAAGYPHDMKKFSHYWPADLHVIGKDILKFHSIIWPAMLMSANMQLPRTVFAHGWLTVREEKISKSKGNIVNPLELKRKYGLDAVKYFLMRELTLGMDGDYSEDALRTRYETELANELGNLLNRTLVMIEKYCNGTVPSQSKKNAKQDDVLLKALRESPKKIDSFYEKLQFNNALAETWKIVATANRYINETEPWELARAPEGRNPGKPERQERLQTVLYNLAEALRVVSVLIMPVLAESSASMRSQLGLPVPKSFDEALKQGLTRAGTKVRKGEVLFKKLD